MAGSVTEVAVLLLPLAAPVSCRVPQKDLGWVLDPQQCRNPF